MISLTSNKWIITALIMTLGMPCFAKKSKKQDEEASPIVAPVEQKALTPFDIEQKIMKLISLSILEGDKSHWASETLPDNPPAEILIVESPSNNQKDRGNALVIARPGIYPYQARWYPSFRQHMTNKGWRLMSLGLLPTPTMPHTPRSQLIEPKIEELKTEKSKTEEPKTAEPKTEEQQTSMQEQQANYKKTIIQWENQAISRGKLLTTFSNNNNTSAQAILIGVGLSAHIAGLIAADPSTQLTGLVLIDLESPPSDSVEDLAEKLSRQGPILEIVTQSKIQIVQSAKHRKKRASQAGNKDYRLVFAPAGLEMDGAAQSWLTTTIHGWAITTQKK